MYSFATPFQYCSNFIGCPRRNISFSALLCFLIITAVTTPATATIDTFVYGGCSQQKFTPNSPYQFNVDSLLTSLLNSATTSTFNNFTISSALTKPDPHDTVSGLFQCRADLKHPDCARCVADAVSQLGTLCANSAGGALQLDGCFVKFDNATFLGVEDKTVVVNRCGPGIGDSDELTRKDAVLGFLGAGGELYRVGESGRVSGVAQCVGDLNVGECQDCLVDAIGRLRSECAMAEWGDMYLAKCYARYSGGGFHSRSGSSGSKNDDDDEIEKTLAILIGLIAGVCLVIVFLSFLSKLCGKRDGK